MKFPESMDECVYFTNRVLTPEGKGSVVAWVYRNDCPKCGKAKMGKPVDEKTGQPKIRAKEYVCPSCGYTVEKTEYEDTLTCDIQYTCDSCGHEGETQVPFKRKKYMGADAVVFTCEGCGKKIAITKKMKALKEK